LHLCALGGFRLRGNIHGFNALSHRRAGRASGAPGPAADAPWMNTQAFLAQLDENLQKAME
jgi:hypothetical protein